MFDDGYLEMYKKFDNMLDLKLDTEVLIVSKYIQTWREQKPESEQLKEIARAFTEIAFILNRLQMDRRMYHKSLKEYRDKANSLVLDKRDLQEKLNKLTNENTNRTDNY